ncbi:TIR domain-containing protein [Methylobacter tundripaludum]|uniref:TIR domain-containing protein n=1 Tax=Methylobacter tundripaludum TaxID=173365 RepID=A0A2S6H8T5_9GAMM|nr:toll/interleukin-1 receptor domain-containing protein [Methylobacter tundripaludum]PPK73902.1 TIR domain-containing protein [Methylobacter tundripaludum]
MSLLDVIEVSCNGFVRRIELHQGDLTELMPEDQVDILILSAFPDVYIPIPTSLIGALFAKGLSVSDLARNKAVDLRKSFSCWLSEPISAVDSGLQYDRILCFEPLVRGAPQEVVGDIFRALAPFLAGDPPIRTAAMPIVAAGNQGHSINSMLPPIIEAAVNWMGVGMPLETLKIFAHSKSDGRKATKIFGELKDKHNPPSARTSPYQYDVFISYCRANVEAADIIQQHLAKHDLRVFIDTQDLAKGAAWQPHIFRALDDCARMIAVYSPAYIDSKVCQEEFNIAWARGRKQDLNIIYPIYWESADLPTYMEMLDYTDCRESRSEKLTEACAPLLREFCR